MMGFKGLLFICCVYFSFSLKVSGQICVYQEIFKGGVTGDSFNPWSSNLSGQFDVYIEPGSTIKDAYLFVNVLGDPIDDIVIFNGVNIALNQENTLNNSYLYFNSSIVNWTIKTLMIDVKTIINPNNNSYTIVPPQNQPATLNPGVFSEYYLYIAYENPTLDFVNSTVFVNDIQPQQTQSYNLIDINSMNLLDDVLLAVFSSAFCDTVQDGSFVSVDSNPIGILGGDDDNTPLGCLGVSGSFYYQLSTAFGLGNDTPDAFMSGTDAIATIENYVVSTNSLNIKFEYQTPSFKPRTNPVHQLYLTYTTPCDTFSVSVPNDTTVCEGTQLQLNASTTNPTATYEWEPSTGLSCSNCPNPIFTADSSMFYTVRIWNNDSCSVVRPIKINVRPRPIFGEIVTTASECGASTGSATLNASPNNGIVDSWQEVGGNNQPSNIFQNLGSGNHTFFFIDTNGCQSNDSIIVIDEVNSTVANFTANPMSGAVPLDVSFTNTSLNASNYEWSVNGNNEGNNLSNYTFDPSGTYVVTLVAWQNDPACADTAYKTIFVYDSLLVEIPNVFTPNGDGLNDFFSINSNMPINCHLVIVNRWGNVMHEFNGDISAGTTNLWDATLANEGVYFYTLRFDASSETPEGVKFLLPAEKEGFVTLAK
jgi:gliding motility-associated-like protein